MLQNRAARIVRGVKFEGANHNQLLRSLEWLSIRQLIDHYTASFMYKVANGTVQFMFYECTNIRSHNTRSASSGNYVIPKTKTAKGQTVFVFSGAQVWNNRLSQFTHSTKHMMTIKIKTFLYVQGFFYSFSICLVHFLVGPFIFLLFTIISYFCFSLIFLGNILKIKIN